MPHNDIWFLIMNHELIYALISDSSVGSRLAAWVHIDHNCNAIASKPSGHENPCHAMHVIWWVSRYHGITWTFMFSQLLVWLIASEFWSNLNVIWTYLNWWYDCMKLKLSWLKFWSWVLSLRNNVEYVSHCHPASLGFRFIHKHTAACGQSKIYTLEWIKCLS